ncbi:MAG: hypothetical protein HYZ08_00320 [Candidatus Kerfeldbacteria bacterium]|nr:hypothetical protein [Candidatus Kerfeldbacteria bacterium]
MISTSLKLISIALLPLFLFGCSSNPVGDGGVFRSDDQGETWAQKVFVGKTSKGEVRIDQLAVKRFVEHPTREDTLYLLAGDGVYVTTNDGEQWDKLPLNANAVALAIDPSLPDTMYLSTGTQIVKTVNAGTSWEVVYQDSQGRQVTHVLVDPQNSNRILAFLTTPTVLISRNAGTEWSQLSELPVKSYAREVVRSPVNPNMLYSITEANQFLRSGNGGELWEDLTEPMRASMRGLGLLKNLQVTVSGRIYLGSNRTLLTSSDEGSQWSVIPTLLSEESTLTVYIVDPQNPEIIYFADGRTVHRTTNAGKTWETLETYPSSRMITSLSLKRGTLGQVIFAGAASVPEKKNPYFPFL